MNPFNFKLQTKPYTFCGRDVFITEFNALKNEEFNEILLEPRKSKQNAGRLCQMGLVDVDGKELATVEHYMECPGPEVRKAVYHITKFNMKLITDVNKNIEELEKKLETTTDSDCPSDSQKPKE